MIDFFVGMVTGGIGGWYARYKTHRSTKPFFEMTAQEQVDYLQACIAKIPPTPEESHTVEQMRALLRHAECRVKASKK